MRKALGAIFGLKLLPVSGDMVHAAKDMLDTEMEYIEYLRKRKRFFFMTQVQQTRVAVVPKGRKKGYSQSTVEDRRKRRTKRRSRTTVPKTWLAIAEQKARIAGKKTGKALNKKSTAAANKISKFMRAKKPIGANKITKFVRKPAKTITTAGARGTNAATKAIGGNVATMTKAHPMTIGKNKIVPTKGLTKGVSKTAKKEAVEQLTKTAGKKALKKAGGKAATKLAGKTLIKVGLKKVPLLGAIMGTVFGIERLLKGDINGAMMEVASGVASTIPGKGTAVSLAIDAALIAKDVAEAAKQPTDEQGTQATGLKDGGQVGSPTQALIAEGGEPELVVPHSKLGPVFQSLLKQVGTVLTDVTTGFLTTLPVPSASSQAVLGEAARLQALFGANAAPVGVFKGSKISKLGGFLKKAAGAAWKASPMGMVAGVVGSMFKGKPAKESETQTIVSESNMSFRNGELVSSSSSEETLVPEGDTSSVGGAVPDSAPAAVASSKVMEPVKKRKSIASRFKSIASRLFGMTPMGMAISGGKKIFEGDKSSTQSKTFNNNFFSGEGEIDFDEFERVSDYARVNGKYPGEEGYKKHTLSDSTKRAFQKDNPHLIGNFAEGGGNNVVDLGGTTVNATMNTSSSSIAKSTKPLANGLSSTQPGFIPMPVVVPQLIPIPVTKVVKEKVVQHKSYGIEPFSGKYVEL